METAHSPIENNSAEAWPLGHAAKFVRVRGYFAVYIGLWIWDLGRKIWILFTVLKHDCMNGVCVREGEECQALLMM